MMQLSAIETGLTAHPCFGSSRAIEGRLRHLYRFALEVVVGDEGAAAGPADERGEDVLLSPELRIALDGWLAGRLGAVASGATGVTDAVRRAIEEARLTRGRSHRIQDGPLAGVELWSFGASADQGGIFVDATTTELSEGLARESAIRTSELPLRFVDPSRSLIEAVDAAAERLAGALPRLGPSALAHLRRIVFVETTLPDVSFHSAALRSIPGTILIAPVAAEDLDQLAETIFHESLHLKLFDISMSTPLVSPASDERIRPPWKRSSTGEGASWPVDRALGAFHVYAHLSVFALATRSRRAGSAEQQGLASSAGERAAFLGRQLLETTSLTPKGRELSTWLLAYVDKQGAETGGITAHAYTAVGGRSR